MSSSHDKFGTDDGPGPEVPVAPGRNAYQFSNEELRVLRECNRESFIQRCIPLGTVLGVATYYGVQTGYLKPSRRWGATPKVILAAIVGYFVGKFSYQTKCAEKLMQLPDSRIGAMLRQRKRGGFTESMEPGFGPGMSLSPFSSTSPSDTYSDLGPNGDIDTTRPEQNELDDAHRPTLDSNPVFEEESMPPIQDKSTTYDELRKKNREDFQKHRSPRGTFDSSDSSTAKRTALESHPNEGNLTRSKRTNIYGDAME